MEIHLPHPSGEAEDLNLENVSLDYRMKRLERMLLDCQSPCYLEGLLDVISGLVEDTRRLAKSKSNRLLNAVHEKFKFPAEQIIQHRLRVTDFEFIKPLGKGAFGEVQLVRHSFTREVFAMKILSKNKMLEQPGSARFWEERDIMAKAQSDWIVKLFYAIQDEDNLYMVMEFMAGNNLSTWLNQCETDVPEEEALFYIAECILGLDALHQLGYIHRDVKPANILLDQRGHVKLADFGTALLIDPQTGRARTSDAVGTPDFLSPEVLKCQGNELAEIGPEVDWWALGCMLYEMLFVDPPFYSDSLAQTYNMIMNHQHFLRFPENTYVSEETKQLIRGFICDQNERLGVGGIIEIQSQLCFHGRSWTWETLQQHQPPFIPQLHCDTDTTYFELSDDEDTSSATYSRQREEQAKSRLQLLSKGPKPFTGEQLNFAGFSYTQPSFSLFSRFDSSGSQHDTRRREDTSSGVSTATVSSQVIYINENSFKEDAPESVVDLQRFHHQINALNERIHRQEVEIEDLNNQLAETMDERDALAKERRLLASLKLQTEKEKATVEEELEAMKRHITDLQSRGDNLQERLSTAQSDLHIILLENATYETTVEALRAQLEETEKIAQSHFTSTEDLRMKNYELSLLKEQMEEKLALSQNQCALQEKQVGNLQLDLETLQSIYSQVLTQKNSGISQENDLRQERDDLQEEKLSLEKKCYSLTMDISRMTQVHNSLIQTEKEGRERIATLQHELQTLQESYETFRQTVIKEQEQWQRQKNNFKYTKKELVSKLEEKGELIDQMSELLENIREELGRRKEDLKASHEQTKRFSLRNEELSMEVDKWKRKDKLQTDAYKKYIKDMEETMQEQECQKRIIQKAYNELKEEIIAKDEKMNELARQWAVTKVNNEQLVIKLKEVLTTSKNKDILSHSSKENADNTSSREMKRLRDELREARHLVADQRKAHTALKDEIEERFIILEVERDELQRHLEVAHHELAERGIQLQQTSGEESVQSRLPHRRYSEEKSLPNLTEKGENEDVPPPLLRQSTTRVPLTTQQHRQMVGASWTFGQRKQSFTLPLELCREESSSNCNKFTSQIELESYLDIMGGFKESSNEIGRSTSTLTINSMSLTKRKNRQKKNEWQGSYARILPKEKILAFYETKFCPQPQVQLHFEQIMFIRKATEADAAHARRGDISRIFQVIYDLDSSNHKKRSQTNDILSEMNNRTVESSHNQLPRRLSDVNSNLDNDIETSRLPNTNNNQSCPNVNYQLKDHRFQPMVFRFRQHCQVCNETIGRLFNPPTSLQCVNCLLKMCTSHAVIFNTSVSSSYISPGSKLNISQKLPPIPSCSHSVGSYLLRAPTQQLCDHWLQVLLSLQEEYSKSVPNSKGKSSLSSPNSSASSSGKVRNTTTPIHEELSQEVPVNCNKTSENVTEDKQNTTSTVPSRTL